MKILILLFSASLFLSSFISTSYQEQESPELKEAIELTNSLVKLFNEGKYDEALPLAKRALQIREKLLPRTDARISNALVNLAEVYLAKKDYNSAKQTFERALPLQEERFGPTHEKLGAGHMCQGSPYLVESCIKAALKSRFTPTVVSGVPSKAKGVIQYRFVHQGTTFR